MTNGILESDFSFEMHLNAKTSLEISSKILKFNQSLGKPGPAAIIAKI